VSEERKGSDLDLRGLLDGGLRELIRLVSESGVTELVIERGDTRLRLRSRPARPAPADPTQTALPATTASADAAQPAPERSTVAPVLSPIVGTYFSAASPGAEPFVVVGDYVEEGQTVGIVEAMKIMNEIETDLTGRVTEILVQNGQAVEYGTPLMLIDTSVRE
jgi:acetyl-CoA carboxylase biotin carboxyl carrier protein